jgi:hypothetical protein
MSPFIARRSLLGLLAASSVSPAVLSQTVMPAPVPVPVKVAVPGNLYARLERGQATGLFLETVAAVLEKMGRSSSFVTMPTGDALGELTRGGVGLAYLGCDKTRRRTELELLHLQLAAREHEDSST